LKQEGIARDIVNRIQNLRKDLGLEVQDKIKLLVADSNAEVNAAITRFGSYIQEETQAISLSVGTLEGEATVLDMDDFELAVRLIKA
jgi:isoleucyl-tRNA synthetase